jgi:YD repeat-containing protein
MTEKRNTLNHILNTWSYNAQDRAVSKFSVDGKGAENISYVSDTHVDVTDAYGTDRTYQLIEIDGTKRVSVVQGTSSPPYSNGDVVRWSYDDNKRVTETESAGGTINQYQGYDERGNPETVKLAVGTPEERLITYTYHPDMNAPLSRSEASVLGNGSKISIWDYDDDYNSIPNENPTHLISRIVKKGFTKDNSGVEAHYEYVTTFTYNSKGQVLSIDGPVSGLDDTTAFNYDPTTGDLLSITQPLVGTTIFSDYDPAGRVGKITNVNAQTKRFTYDAKGRVTAVINDADGSHIKITYNLGGLPDSVIDEDGVTRSFDYENTYGRLSRISDLEGNHIAYAYDTQGNWIEMSKHDPGGTRTFRKRRSYQHPTVPGKLWKEINPDESYTECGYDNEGKIAYVKDPNNNTTYYAYDPLNRLKRVTQPGSVVTNYGYDAHGNLVSVTDAEGHMTTYEYDDMGRVVSTTSPDTGIVNYVYDAAGNLLGKTDAKGITVQYAYDLLNRLTAVYFPDPAEDIVYAYDEGIYGMGSLTGMTDPSGSASFTYEARGRLAKKTSTIFGHSYTVGYNHTPGNRLSSITYPSRRRVDSKHDAIGKIEAVYTAYDERTTELFRNIIYLPFGPATSLMTGNGSTVKTVFDERYRMAIANPYAQTERVYGYDANGNITSIDVTSQPWKSQNFNYDTLNRLVEAAGIYGTISYTYDKVGNRLTRSVNDQTAPFNRRPKSH